MDICLFIYVLGMLAGAGVVLERHANSDDSWTWWINLLVTIMWPFYLGFMVSRVYHRTKP